MADLDLNQKEKVNAVLSFVVLKKLITPIKNTKAFEKGYVDASGKLTEKGHEIEEKDPDFSFFDKVMFKIKRLLGSRTAQLNTFIYLQTVDTDFYDDIVIKGGIHRRGEVKRVMRDVEKIIEKHDISMDDLTKMVLIENMQDKDVDGV